MTEEFFFYFNKLNEFYIINSIRFFEEVLLRNQLNDLNFMGFILWPKTFYIVRATIHSYLGVVHV